MKPKARILLFTGDGKGKTTASLGLALRAAGHGMNVIIIQFVKDCLSGEVDAVKNFPNIEIVQTGKGFVPPEGSKKFTEHKLTAEKGLALATEKITSGHYQVIVLDEICCAVSKGLLNEQEVVDIVKKADVKSCVVLTGRNAATGLVNIADTVSEIRCIKHGFQSGKHAQKGVEH